MENKKRNKLVIILLAILLLLAMIFGLSKLLNFKKGNSISVVETQDNSLFIPSYNENESFVFSFLPAENANGYVTYKLISAKDVNYNEVNYFSLVNEKDTRIMVEKGTPAGTYTLTIRAHATGSNKYKAADKDIIYLYTIGKADNGYLMIPQAVEGLVYDGSSHALLIPGSAINGTIMYKLDDGEWSSEIPQATEPGIYTVSYKVVGDQNHCDVVEESVMVVIEQKNVGYRPGFSFSGNISLSDLIAYIRSKDASTHKIPVSGKPETYVEYTYDGNVHTNNYTAPEGIDMIGDDEGRYAGTYYATYTPDIDHCWSDGTRTPVTVTLQINKAKLAKPSVDDTLFYNGEIQYAKLVGFDDQKMIVIGNKGKSAGTYHAIVTLKDKFNYTWDDSSIKDVSLEWHIFKHGIKVPVVTTIYTYKATLLLDLPVLQFVTADDYDEFDEKLIKIESGYSGALAGDYQVRLSLRNKENFAWEDGSVEDKYVSWTINRKPISDKPVDRIITFDGKPHDNGYDKPLFVSVRGDTYGRKAGVYTAYYKPLSNYCWSDGTYDEVEVKLIIEKAIAQISKEAKAKDLTYNNIYQELVTRAEANVGKVLYKVNSPGQAGNYTHYIPTGLNADTYTVFYKAEGDENHDPSEEKIIEVVIEKAEPTIGKAPTGIRVTYDGNKHELVVPGSSDHGVFEYRLENGIYSTAVPEATEAGIYTVYVRFIGDRNHKDKDEFTITSRILSKSDPGYIVEPEAIESTYDGKSHKLITAGSVDKTVGTIKFSRDGENWSAEIPEETAAGEYDVYYMIKGSENYEDSEVSKTTAVINRADFVIEDNDQVYDYDGNKHGTGLSVTTVDQSTPLITYSFEGSKYTSEVPAFEDVYVNFKGEVIVREIKYKVEAENFNTKEGVYTVLINRVDPICTITYPELTYDGQTHDLIEANVEGGKILYSWTGADITFKEVTPYAKNAGEYEFYYRIDGDINHNNIGKTKASNSIKKAGINIEFLGNEFAYTGKPQGNGISASTDDGSDVVVRYGTSEGRCNDTSVPKITNVEESRTIYFEAKAVDHETEYGSYTLKIEPVAPTFTAPAAIDGLFYDGTYHQLVTPGSSNDGTMMYRIDSEGSTGNYTTYVPTGLDAKEYKVYYYCAGDGNHTDSEVGTLTVSIGVNNRTHLKLLEESGEIDPGKQKEIGIETNSNGELSCSSTSESVGCSIDSENMKLHIVTAEKMVDEEVTITVYVKGGNYHDHSVTYTLTVKGNSDESEPLLGLRASSVMNKEEFDETDTVENPTEGSDPKEIDKSEGNLDPVTDDPTEPEAGQEPEQEPEQNQIDVVQEIEDFVIAKAKAEITSMTILSQYDMYDQPVSYFTREGRLIKPAKDTPAGKYKVEVKVTIEFEVDENGNSKIVKIDTDDEIINQEINNQETDNQGNSNQETVDQGPSQPAPAEVNEGSDDEDDEIMVPEAINEKPAVPQVVSDDSDDSNDDILDNSDLNPLYDPNNDLNVETSSNQSEENEENNEAE
ncbi:MAG: hypothetical protein IJH00_04050 [Erysipelotrichaceae bacterium]|nr:hypothetical protein [Erysipelotrichaceae bacterium]